MNVSTRIAEELGEKDPVPLAQIAAVVDALGDVEALGLLAQTERIEASGGMLVPDGSRKRTRGGIYFALARATLTAEQRKRIFAPGGPVGSGVANGGAPAASTNATAVTAAPADFSQRLVRLPRRDPNRPAGGPTENVKPVRVVTLESDSEPETPKGSNEADRVFMQIERMLATTDGVTRREVERRLRARFGPAVDANERAEELESSVRQWVTAVVAAKVGLQTGETAQAVFGSDSPANRQTVTRLQELSLADLIAAHDEPRR